MTRLAFQLIGTLLLVGLMLKYWWLIALVVCAVVCAVVVWKRAPGWCQVWAEQRVAEGKRVAAIQQRAEQQHAWVLAGDPRGTYGQYPPKEWTWAEDALTAMREHEREVKR